MKILIVEDEPLILRSVERLVAELKPDWQIRSALNAIEARGIADLFRPDILLTDINMPVISGLELARELGRQLSTLQIVILSGYSDFEYAQSAMKLGVRHYLLKPVKRLELMDLLNQLEQERRERSNQELRRQLRRALINVPSAEDREEIETLEGMQTLVNCEYFLLLSVCGTRDMDVFEKESSKLKRLRESGLDEFLETLGGPACVVFAFESPFGSRSHILALPAGAGQSAEGLFANALHSWAAEHPPFNLILSPVLPGRQDLLLCQADILKNLESYADLRGGKLHRYGQAPARYLPNPDALSPLYQQFWTAFARTSQMPCHTWEQILAQWQNADLNQAACRIAIRNFCEAASDSPAPPQEQGRRKVLQTALVETLCEASDWAEFAVLAQDCLQTYADEQRVPERDESIRHSEICISVRRYLEENFRTPVDNTELSQKFNYSPAYLSSLFKNAYGYSPTEYLNQLRIDEAKRIMRTRPELSTTDVALESGFSDGSYFSKVFKKLCGLSPRAYRQGH